MAEHDDTVVHEADGIQELDNQLPRWWLLLFYITIVIAILYMGFFHVLGLGKGQHARYAAEVARAEARLADRRARETEEIDYSTPNFETAVLDRGKEIFNANCASCHHATGRGFIGPNLTDAYWIHGATFDDTMHVIAEGVLEKGMAAWKNQLSPDQRYAVASYIYSLRGSNPDSPRAPEGEFVQGSDSPEWR
ncbi:MAG: c-type cytochrome [Verrucomicrobia bacterium]|nr:c-type cytochrome [Verrucomicrobiota bacterium]MCH8514031.1 c-type cytochrome [Kiritimatiellia bacterium]